MFLPGPSPITEEELNAYVENLPPLTPFPGVETRMAAIRGVHFNPFAIPSDDESWKEESHKEYVGIKLAIIAYAEAWGRLVEEAVGGGEDFINAIETGALLANCNNIAPHHFLAAGSYLSSFWVLRAHLVIWWNSQG